MFFMIKDAKILTLENVYHSPFTLEIYKRCIFTIIVAIKLFSQLFFIYSQQI